MENEASKVVANLNEKQAKMLDAIIIAAEKRGKIASVIVGGQTYKIHSSNNFVISEKDPPEYITSRIVTSEK
ncbi:hypothetical protein [Pollutibacter soli]|uniref:hypothetical protein n=1 Tax=Pollutibacter soli TaxID=3034157 RepID=UPI00301403D7